MLALVLTLHTPAKDVLFGALIVAVIAALLITRQSQ